MSAITFDCNTESLAYNMQSAWLQCQDEAECWELANAIATALDVSPNKVFSLLTNLSCLVAR